MTNTLPLLIEPTELNKCLDNDKLLVIDLCNEQQFLSGHIPNAVHVAPAELVSGEAPAAGKLPSIERLSALFSRIGLTPDTHVIAYDDEGGGWAGRFIWTLDMIGHTHYSLLNGGLLAWYGENLPLTQDVIEPAPSEYSVTLQHSPQATKDYIVEQLQSPDFVVWDARSADEHAGRRETALRNGHIPNAIHCEWTDLMDRQNHLRLREDLSDFLATKGFKPEQNIVTHCHSHHRSGLTYFAGKLLGLSIKAYDGSWGEWGNDPLTPIETV